MDAWNRLRDIFQDNQNSRVVALEQEFSPLSMEDFVSASAYCQRLKELSDQLKNVGSPVSNDRLVLQLVSGLTPAYNTIGTLIRQNSPLPPFYQARTMLTLEDAGFAKQTATSTTAAMVAASSAEPPTYQKTVSTRAPQSGKKNSGGRRGGSGGGRGSEGGRGGRRGGGPYQSQPGSAGWKQHWGGYPWQWAWPYPPCLYPSATLWARPTAPRPPAVHPGPGVLGPRPQAYVPNGGQPTPTEIEAAMYTLGLTPPDANWYLDIGATSHMTSGQGTLSLSPYVQLSNSRGILVGNGHSIPIHGYGHTTLSSPVSVEFDPFGFSVKDYQTGTHLMRCDSHGDLYPITTTPTYATPSTFAALAHSLWHVRLGQPGNSILYFL